MCIRAPRISSAVRSLHTHAIPSCSWMALPSPCSDTPSAALAFLPALPAGTLGSRKPCTRAADGEVLRRARSTVIVREASRVCTHLQRRRHDALGDVVAISERLLGAAEEELRLELQDQRELAVILDRRLSLCQCRTNFVTLFSLKEQVAHGRLQQDEADIRLRPGRGGAGGRGMLKTCARRRRTMAAAPRREARRGRRRVDFQETLAPEGQPQ